MAGPQAKGQTRGSTIDIGALTELWHQLKQADRNDTEAQAELRQVLSRLRKVKHSDLHPDCPDVEVDVPLHSASTPQKPVYFHIGNATGRRVYHGKCLVTRCVAQQLLSMIARDRETEQKRMTAGGNTIYLREEGRISDIARQVASS